jgi:hypothetical protein
MLFMFNLVRGAKRATEGKESIRSWVLHRLDQSVYSFFSYVNKRIAPMG